jgi:hypothetical protein
VALEVAFRLLRAVSRADAPSGWTVDAYAPTADGTGPAPPGSSFAPVTRHTPREIAERRCVENGRLPPELASRSPQPAPAPALAMTSIQPVRPVSAPLPNS